MSACLYVWLTHSLPSLTRSLTHPIKFCPNRLTPIPSSNVSFSLLLSLFLHYLSLILHIYFASSSSFFFISFVSSPSVSFSSITLLPPPFLLSLLINLNLPSLFPAPSYSTFPFSFCQLVIPSPFLLFVYIGLLGIVLRFLFPLLLYVPFSILYHDTFPLFFIVNFLLFLSLFFILAFYLPSSFFIFLLILPLHLLFSLLHYPKLLLFPLFFLAILIFLPNPFTIPFF